MVNIEDEATAATVEVIAKPLFITGWLLAGSFLFWCIYAIIDATITAFTIL